jgi:hypothetical protein
MRLRLVKHGSTREAGTKAPMPIELQRYELRFRLSTSAFQSY